MRHLYMCASQHLYAFVSKKDKIMTIHNLDKLFAPSSICVIGATTNAQQTGNIIIRNLMQGGFNGPIMPISTVSKSIGGILTYPSVADLPMIPDLAVFSKDIDKIDAELEALGQLGVKAVMLINYQSPIAIPLPDSVREIAQKYQMRILGPNSMGAAVPAKNFNASTMHLPINKGKIAYVSQSGAMSTTVLDWANAHGVGFSHFISLGNCEGIGFGDIIDYLGSDPFTRAILIYMESLQERRNFMSAARASARNKPILVMKTGRHGAASIATQSHTGAMAGSDLVFDAAFRRAGMLRVDSTAELFAGAETLSMTKPFKGKKLALVSNGGGLNILATDHLLDNGGTLATLSDETIVELKKIIGPEGTAHNPIDVSTVKTDQQYFKIYETLQKCKEVDCVLFLHAPSAADDSTKCATALIDAHKKLKGNLITCWVGEQTVLEARKLFEVNEIPTYTSPRMAIIAFMHIVQFRKNQVMLMETPERVPAEIKPARTLVRKIIDDALENGHEWLKEEDTKAILKAYGIDCVEPYIAKTAEEAVSHATEIGFPVVVKIMSPDIIHKSDVGGVVLSLQNTKAVEDAINAITERVKQFNEDAKIDGFIIQKMMQVKHQVELIAGMTHDPVFGPVILFGEGGVATEVIGDRAIALPPLNMALAKDLISRTQVSKRLKGYRDHAPVDRDSLCQTLIELSEICIDFPEIQEMDINPIFSSSEGALAVDSRIRIKESTAKFPNRPFGNSSLPC